MREKSTRGAFSVSRPSVPSGRGRALPAERADEEKGAGAGGKTGGTEESRRAESHAEGVTAENLTAKCQTAGGTNPGASQADHQDHRPGRKNGQDRRENGADREEHRERDNQICCKIRENRRADRRENRKNHKGGGKDRKSSGESVRKDSGKNSTGSKAGGKGGGTGSEGSGKSHSKRSKSDHCRDKSTHIRHCCRGWVAVLILIIVLLFGGILCMVGGGNSSTVSPVSAEVEAYEPVIRIYAKQYGIEEYVELIKAVMMQESGGQGSDPMQSSESGYNTRYPREPNGITDPEYSIECGVQALKDCLQSAGVENPVDMEHIRLALQGYNFGNGYIAWAQSNYGGYTAANAAEFSDMMAERMGWSSYGDKQYVPHVLQYYIFGRIPTGIGSQAIVQVALTQEGNNGDTYWSWYGFESRVEWCACFVSWCAQQCGYLESGVIPKFSLCSDGVDWFHARGQFQDASYVPAAGDIIFFDWGNDGTIDHVGIVESVTNGVVNTIEGNSGDKVARRSYNMGSDSIYGYGVPAY